MEKLFWFVLIGGFFASQAIFTVNGQEKLRTIREARHNRLNAPITIVGREVKGRSLNSKETQTLIG